MAKPAYRGIDHTRIYLLDLFPAKTQLPHCGWPEIFDNNIRNLDQFTEDFLSFFALQIQDHALLVTVEAYKIPAPVFARLADKGSEFP